MYYLTVKEVSQAILEIVELEFYRRDILPVSIQTPIKGLFSRTTWVNQHEKS